MKEERLQDLETGRKGLTLGEAIKYADIYNVSLEYIAGRKRLDTSNSEENIEAKKMAVKALEKQRQKKIETWNGQASCPCCKKLFGEMKTIRNLTTWEMPYCKFCGQALDWSDEQ